MDFDIMNLIDLPSGIETKAFVLGEHAIDDLPEVLSTFFPNKHALLIADENTWQAAGARVQNVLAESNLSDMPVPVIYGKARLHPDSALSDSLCEKFTATEDIVPVAVGSGVINDVVKCAAGKSGKTFRFCLVLFLRYSNPGGRYLAFQDFVTGTIFAGLQEIPPRWLSRPCASEKGCP